MRLRSIDRRPFAPAAATTFEHPNESAKNRLAYRQFHAGLSYAATRYARGRLVDVGCGSKGWEPVFAAHVTEHIGVDREQKLRDGKERVDIVASAYDVPLEDGAADTVLLTEVLEHLQEPKRALAECHRLLADGGHLIATSPFIWPVHDEYDFFRYTPQAFRFLLDSTGFEVIEVQPLGGVWSTMSLELGYALQRYRKPGLAPVVDGMCLAAQWLATRWEGMDFQPKFSWNHLAVGKKAP